MYGNGNIGKIEVKYSWVTKRNSGGGPSEGSGSSGSPGEGLPQELVLSRSDAVYYYVHDYLGSIAATLDNRGEFVFAEQVYPYGEVKQKYEAGTATQQRFDFTGKERDSETGLHYYGASYYDSKLGIWLSVDPLLDKYPGLSPYNYCMNNPMNAVDPDGKQSQPLINRVINRFVEYIEKKAALYIEKKLPKQLGEKIANECESDELNRPFGKTGEDLDYDGVDDGQDEYFNSMGYEERKAKSELGQKQMQGVLNEIKKLNAQKFIDEKKKEEEKKKKEEGKKKD